MTLPTKQFFFCNQCNLLKNTPASLINLSKKIKLKKKRFNTLQFIPQCIFPKIYVDNIGLWFRQK